MVIDNELEQRLGAVERMARRPPDPLYQRRPRPQHEGPPLEMLNVLDFGAKGDGLSNDSPAFQRAADEADRLGGARILIPHGTYKLDSTMQLGQNTCLEGAGFGTVLTGTATQLIKADTANTFMSISNMKIAPTRATPLQVGVDVVRTWSSDPTVGMMIHNVWFDASNTHEDSIMVFIQGLNGGGFISNCWFEDTGPTGDGVGIEIRGTGPPSGGCMGVTIMQCHFITLKKCIFLNGTVNPSLLEGIAVIGCNLGGNRDFGIDAKNVTGLRILGCEFDSGIGLPIGLDSTAFAAIENCWIATSGNNYACIAVYTNSASSPDLKVIGCRITSAATTKGDGIRIDAGSNSVSGATIIGNTIVFTGTGINLGLGANPVDLWTIIGNHLGSNSVAIDVGGRSYNAILGNTLTANTQGIVNLGGVGNEIAHNVTKP